jgi:hypothetical protein
MDSTTDIRRTPRGGADAGAHPDPSRPFPDRTLTDQRTAGVGLPTSFGASFRTALTSELFGVLDRGLYSLGDTRNGHSWPRPRKHAIQQLVESYDEETCRQAAKEAREIVQSQDRAPNVTGLFAKKCADVAAERESIRETVRRSLA